MRESKTVIALAAALLLSGGAAWAAEIFVDDDAARGGKGSAKRPLRSVAAAIAKARPGDTIRVAAGRYRENLLLRRKAVKLLGGYAPGFASRDIKAHASRLVGDGKDAVLTILAGRGVLVEGFVISGGGGSHREAPHYINGGGVYVRGGDVTLRKNTVEGNATHRSPKRAERSGGGIFASGGKIVLVDNIVRRNVSHRGGGVAVIAASAALIEGNRIADNTSESDHGGGLYVAESKATLKGNVITGNVVGRKLGYGWGGGVLITGKGARVLMTGNTVRDNLAVSLGSGVFIDDEADATLRDELIVGNRCAREGGSAVYVDGLDKARGSKARLQNCTVLNHACKGSRGGEGVRVEQGSTVVVERSVFWNNGDDFSADKSSRLRVRRTLSRDPVVSSGVKTRPVFVDGARGDHRLRAPKSALGWGVRWGTTAAPNPAIPRAAAAPSAAPPASGVRGARSAPKVAHKDESCAVGGVGSSWWPTGLILLFLSGRRRLRRRH